jgi:hypothetical protein
VLFAQTISATGLGRELSAALGPWREPLAVHDPAKVVLDLAVALALGGDCLADVAVLRGESGVYGPAASDATVSRTITALAANVPATLKAVDTARATGRANTWKPAGINTPDHGRSAANPLVGDLEILRDVGHRAQRRRRLPRRSNRWGFGATTRSQRSSITAGTAPVNR